MLGINQREDVAAAAAAAGYVASPLSSLLHPSYTPLIKSDKRFRFAIRARLSIDFSVVVRDEKFVREGQRRRRGFLGISKSRTSPLESNWGNVFVPKCRSMLFSTLWKKQLEM